MCEASVHGTVLCVSEELAEIAAQDREKRALLVRLEDALITARAEAVLLRRLLARAEELREEDLVTLQEIEAACAHQGYEPGGGQPVALWIEAAIGRVRGRAESPVDRELERGQ